MTAPTGTPTATSPKRSRREPGILGGVMRLATPFVILLLVLSAPLEAADKEWPQAQKAFKDKFKLDGLEKPGVRSQLRAKKYDAIKIVRKCPDARGVDLLIKYHKKQLGFIGDLDGQWAKRYEAWKKAEPTMRKVLEAKSKKSTNGQISVTPAEKAWIDEPAKLATLRREISNEEEIADSMRMAMAKIANNVEGKERASAVASIAKAIKKGAKEDEREFIRLLGYIDGDEATQILETHAKNISPFVSQPALEALGRQQNPRSIDTLLGRLDDPRWQLRVAALKGLSFYRDPRVVDALLERLPNEDGVLKRHYYTALARILGESLAATDEAWISFWKSNKDDLLKRWASKDRSGPVREDLPPVEIKSEGNSGGTSFYGLRTESKHIIFVIDISGSMGEQGGKNEQGHFRVDVAKRELSNAIKTLRAEDGDERGEASFNVVAYSADVVVYKTGKMMPATMKEKEKAFKWIDELEANGATNISDALEQAFDIINTRKAKKQFEKGADTIFLMTDGKPTAGKVMDPVLIREMVKKMNRERQITIHTIGVGDGHDASFLKALATENNGEYLAR